jgi:protein-tyrosine phosphatase
VIERRRGRYRAVVTTSVLRVAVESVEPGTIDVSWELDGPPAEVDVAFGPTPDHIDHVHAETIDAGVTTTRLRGLAPGRHFVSVSVHGGGGAVVAADRRLPFEGLQNFRDLGGYAASGGRTTRWGLVFRADSLHKLTRADLDAFEQLGMGSVFDLRGDEERRTHPNPVRSTQLAIVGQPPGTGRGGGALPDVSGLSPDGEQILRDLYIGMLEHSAELFGQLLGGLPAPGALPAVFHCHAGKDRTGMTAALLLLALGVDRESVLDDYELTRRYRTREHQHDTFDRLVARGLSPEAAAGVLSAPRWAMSDALDALRDVYGGVENYLTTRARLADSQLDELRSRLLA